MKNIFYLVIAFLCSIVIIVSCTKTENSRTLTTPTVTTDSVNNIAGPSATAYGYIPGDGGSVVTAAGICYDIAAGVDISKNKVPAPAHTIAGKFSASLTGLPMGKTIYYKAYAVNAKGVVYGAEKSFYAPVAVNGYFTSASVAKENLVGYWAFENSYIDSVSKTLGVANNASAISFVSGLKGKAVQVASPGYINTNVTNTISNLGSFSMAFWMQQPPSLSNGPKTYMPFSLNAAGYSWEQTKLFFLIDNPSDAKNATGKFCLMDGWFAPGQVFPKLLDGGWRHITITYDNTNGNVRIYVDGVLLSQSSSASIGSGQTNFGSATSFTLGGPDNATNAANGWMNSLSGNLDEFKVFNKALSDKEIQAIYSLENGGL